MIAWKRILVHHSATPGNTIASWEAIRKFHVERRGWRDIGYHFGIGRGETGWTAFPGRPLTMEGAHCPGQNQIAIGVCFLGDFSKAEPSIEQLEEGAALISRLMDDWRIAYKEVHPHSDYRATECPGRAFPFDRLLSAVLAETL